MNQTTRTPIVDVCGKRIMDYVIECLSKFNQGTEECIIRAVGKNISEGVEVSQILITGKFGIEREDHHISLHEIQIEKDGPYSCIEIPLMCKNSVINNNKWEYVEYPYVEYPIYHLLLNALLCQKDKLDIYTWKDCKIMSIKYMKWDFQCNIDEALVDDDKKFNRLIEAFSRCGLLLSPSWKKIAEELTTSDDVIIGVDTCILYDTILTEQILSILSLIGSKGYFHTPNWLLIVIPSGVMHEVEQSANTRNDKGFLTHSGRMGFRALQEILELNQAKDLSGISLFIVGEANPVLDTRVEIRGLRKDLAKSFMEAFRQIKQMDEKKEKEDNIDEDDDKVQRPMILSSGDMLIRDQFKHFLREIDFHKGIYFLTSDKSNAALAQAEGLHTIYCKKPYIKKTDVKKSIKPQTINISNGSQGDKIILGVPLGKLIYELAVGFGTIKVVWDNEIEIEIGCDGKGESLDYWLYKKLRINNHDLQKLLNNYNKVGKFPLDKVKKIWDDLNKEVE